MQRRIAEVTTFNQTGKLLALNLETFLWLARGLATVTFLRNAAAVATMMG